NGQHGAILAHTTDDSSPRRSQADPTWAHAASGCGEVQYGFGSWRQSCRLGQAVVGLLGRGAPSGISGSCMRTTGRPMDPAVRIGAHRAVHAPGR
ncbi:MAG: hypothetical protein ACTHQQ_24310, partial [Solirubrobacteraceae bacterium]